MPIFLIDGDVPRNPRAASSQGVANLSMLKANPSISTANPCPREMHSFKPPIQVPGAYSQPINEATAAWIEGSSSTPEVKTQRSEGWGRLQRSMPSALLWLEPTSAWLRAVDPYLWPEQRIRIASTESERLTIEEQLEAVANALNRLQTSEVGDAEFLSALVAVSNNVSSRRRQTLAQNEAFLGDLSKGIEKIITNERMFWSEGMSAGWREAYSMLQARAAEWFLELEATDALQHHCRYLHIKSRRTDRNGQK